MNQSDKCSDVRFMRIALELAKRGLGRVAPNPAVGCVLTQNNQVIARGWTQDGGRPHAETEALDRAGNRAAGSTAYVTLEPCAHTGETGPCAAALINAGIKKVVVAMLDPDPRVNGGGIKLMQDAGLEVLSGVCQEQAMRVNSGFLSRVETGLPLVTLKIASSLDGCISTKIGQSQWITGTEARAVGHFLRSQNDAILIGSGTALKDNPTLTCRLKGLEGTSPIRVVLDGKLRIPPTHKLVKTAKELPVIFFTSTNALLKKTEHVLVLQRSGVRIIAVNEDGEGNLMIVEVLRALGDEGVTRLLVEGGASVATSLLSQKWVDHIFWFRSASIIGGDGTPAIRGFGIDNLSNSVAFSRASFRQVGNDVIEVLERRR